LHWLFPEQLLGVLNYLAQLGIILFMFLVGIEFNGHSLRHKTSETLAISFSSMASPFLLGIALAMSIYQSHAPAGIDFLRFSLFLGTAMSVTAFPVLVRIIKDLRLESHDFAILAISCAALDDALAWCLLAVVVSVSQGQASQVLTQVLGIGIFLLIQYTLVRPFIGYMERKAELLGLHGEILPLMFCLAFVSAIITEKLGVHALFGAFILGSLVSHDSRMAREIQEKTASILNVIFIPLFFAQAGLKTQLTLLASWDAIALLGLVLGLATVGKIGGTYIASVYVCPDKHDALALSVLMNTRGLMEIIVLSVGMQLGIIDSYLFTIFVSMAILTTLMTAPLLKWILHRRSIGIS
jgi:Kef-type K+ transport system membrane component KefB